MEKQNFEYLKNEKSFLVAIKSIFHSFLSATIWWTNKNGRHKLLKAHKQNTKKPKTPTNWHSVLEKKRIKRYYKKHQNDECLLFLAIYYVYSKFIRKSWNLPWIYHFFANLAPSWQHFGCRFLCYPSLAELHYWLIDLHLHSKVVWGI